MDFTVAFPDELEKKNLTNIDFNILKAEIEVVNKREKIKFLGSLKYKNTGLYLFSFRSKAGIEAARIFISKDTILINDRIKKRLFYGSTNYLRDKYGISILSLPLILGDFVDISGRTEQKIECKNGKSEILGVAARNEIKYTIDCQNGKITSAILNGDRDTEDITFLFEKFKIIGNNLFPGNVEFADRNRETIIKIKIDRIEFGGIVKIDFIPGNNYDKIMLK
jgi:hypothetical protein